MRHEFTDDQIIDAKHAAARHMSRDWISRFNVKDIRAFLNALPEPQDDWEECAFEDIQKGDLVKWFYRDKDRENTCIGVAHRLAYTNEAWVTESGAIVADISVQGQYYRIPAPVQHPDPLHDLTILVHGAYGNQYKFPSAYTSDGSAYNIVGLGDTRILPEDITEWEPAKVVPKVVADDEM